MARCKGLVVSLLPNVAASESSDVTVDRISVPVPVDTVTSETSELLMNIHLEL